MTKSRPTVSGVWFLSASLKEGLLSLPFFHLAPPLEVVVSRLGAYGPRRCSREAGGEGPQGPDAGAAFGAREASPGGHVNEKRTSPFLGNYHWSALWEQLHSSFFLE